MCTFFAVVHMFAMRSDSAVLHLASPTAMLKKGSMQRHQSNYCPLVIQPFFFRVAANCLRALVNRPPNARLHAQLTRIIGLRSAHPKIYRQLWDLRASAAVIALGR